MDAKTAKKLLAEGIQLKFFNQALYEKGLITETERNKMVLRIDARNAEKERQYGGAFTPVVEPPQTKRLERMNTLVSER